jgi:sugar O-acyltransferase (sialic acid O-acetyltransferase NeuD family)
MVVADIVRQRNEFELVGFLDDVHPERAGTVFCDAPVLGGRDQLARLRERGIGNFIMGFGNNTTRVELGGIVRAMGFELPTAVHPRAVIGSGVSIGAGTVIKGGATIDPGVTLGEHVILGAACVGHCSVIEDGVRISGGAVIAGNVVIERGVIIAPGASLRDRIRIGQYSVVGVGAAVVSDLPDRVVAYGVPARVMRTVTPEGR